MHFHYCLVIPMLTVIPKQMVIPKLMEIQKLKVKPIAILMNSGLHLMILTMTAI